MNIIWAESFDYFGGTEANLVAGFWAHADITWSLDNSEAATGTYSLAGIGGEVRRVLGDQYTRVGIAMHVKLSALPGGNAQRSVIEFRDQFNAVQVAIVIQSTGKLAIYNQAANSSFPLEGLLGESDQLISTGGWNHIEAWVDVDAASGAVEVRLNQVSAVAVSTVNTDPTGAGEISQFASRASGGQPTMWIDDIVAMEGDSSDGFGADFLGDKKVFTDFPDADTAAVDWTPSSGSDRFAMIDEPDPDGDSTYDEAAVSGNVMGLSFPDLPVDVVSVDGLFMVHLSRKTDAGPCDLQLAVQSGSDEAQGADRPMTTAYQNFGDPIQQDPATGLPWTRVAVNAMTSTLTRTS